MATVPLIAKEAVIQGVVLTPAGQAVSGAAITLRDRSGDLGLRRTTTDNLGHFRIDRVVPSRYGLTVSKAGFVPDDRARITADSPSDIVIRNDERLPTFVTVYLVPQAIVGGMITDEYGDPIQRCRVFLYRFDREGSSSRLSQKSSAAHSDDRGQYRVAGLTSGRYFIVAERSELGSGVPNFYPGEVDFSRAVPVDLGPGETRLGLDIRMRSERGLHIRGVVLDESGNPPPYARVYAIPEGGVFEGIAVSRFLYHKEVQADSDGRFDLGRFPFAGLPAGTYLVKGLGLVTSSASGQDASMDVGLRGVEAGRAVAFGAQRVTLAGVDLDGVVLRLRRPRSLSGQVGLEDGTPVRNVTIKLQAERFSEAMLLGDYTVRSDGDGRFTFPNAWSAKLHVSVSDVPPGTYVKSIRYGDQNLLTTPSLDHTNPGESHIEIILSASAATLQGTVRDRDGSAAVGAQVFAWPKAPASNDDFSGVATNRDGMFTIGNLAPGDYQVISTRSADIQLIRDPRFREAIRKSGVSVTLAASSLLDGVSLQVISWDEVNRISATLR